MKVEQREYRRESLQEQFIREAVGEEAAKGILDPDNPDGAGAKPIEEEEEEKKLVIEESEEEQEEVELSETEVRIEELQEKGDLTDEEQEELAQLQDEIKPVVLKLRDTYGYEELKEREYSDDDEGFAQLSRDVAQIEAKSYLEELHSSNPVLAEFYDHVVNKGLSEELFTFKKTPQDYESFDLKSEDGQQKTLSLFYKEKGLSDDEANDLIENFKNKGVLDEKAKNAKKALDENKQAIISEREQAELAQRQEQERVSKQIQSELEQVFKTKKAGDYVIPDEDVPQLKKFIYEADKDGISFRDKAYAKLSTGEKALYDYILMKGLKVKGLDVKPIIDRISLSERKKQNDQRQGNQIKNSGSKSSSFRKGELDISTIDMSKMQVINE